VQQMTDEDVILQRGLDNLGMRFDPSGGSMGSNASTLCGSTKSVFASQGSKRISQVQLLSSDTKCAVSKLDRLISTTKIADVSAIDRNRVSIADLPV
jgi:hypothetical protein